MVENCVGYIEKNNVLVGLPFHFFMYMRRTIWYWTWWLSYCCPVHSWDIDIQLRYPVLRINIMANNQPQWQHKIIFYAWRYYRFSRHRCLHKSALCVCVVDTYQELYACHVSGWDIWPGRVKIYNTNHFSPLFLFYCVFASFVNDCKRREKAYLWVDGKL